MTVNTIESFPGIITIDTGYLRAGLAASHLLREHDEVALIDVGTETCVQQITAALGQYDIDLDRVRYILVTHVHLDHAGAAGALMQSCPNAELVVHPRGARHMINPEKLVAGAMAVYGEQTFRETIGNVIPVAEERVIEASDGFSLELAGRRLELIDTPGHAKHHYCVYDEASQAFFTGDTFGLSYREFDIDGRAFIFPTTTPVQFDPPALKQSVERLLSYEPERMFLTHFGCVEQPRRLADMLLRQIERFESLAASVNQQAGEVRHQQLLQGVQEILESELRQYGYDTDSQDWLALMEMDLELNAQGLGCWIDYQARQPA